MAKLLLFLLAASIAGGVWWSCKSCLKEVPPHVREQLNPNEWWGPKELKGRQDTSIRNFQIKFEEKMIQDLRNRLKSHRPFTPALEGVGFEYGFNSAQLNTWITYWADKYPFAEREKFLNQFPQFKTNIQGLDIHFIRVKPQVPQNVQVLPLLLLHGWPGSVREFYEAIPLLTKQMEGYNFAFEVIVPNLPGYGFSDPAVRPGMGAPHVAVIMRNLMHRLGYKKFYVQGGDWGAVIASSMVTLYPEDILGHHNSMAMVQTPCNMVKTILGSLMPSMVTENHLVDRMYPLSARFSTLMEETGYFHIQSTKPDTVGIALTDSPAGLLAYTLEKFSTWTVNDFKTLPDGGLLSKNKFTKEQLIDNLMIYWTSSCITTSMRLYAETMSRKTRALEMDKYKTAVPTWVLQAKHELMYQPPCMLREKYSNLVNVTVLEDGGHFFAFEMPKVFAEDVFKAVHAFREEERKKKEQKKEL